MTWLKSLLARKLAVAFLVGFGGVFIPTALNVLDKVASGAPSGVTRAFLYSLVSGAIAAGLRAALALSPIPLIPSDALHGAKPASRGPALVSLLAETPGVGRLGRHVEHDPRSRAYAVLETGSRLKKVRWNRSGNPFNQGQLGSCTGNAITGILNTAPFHKAGSKLRTEKDAVAIYEAATVIDGIPGQYPPSDTGSSGLAVCKVAKTRGLISGYQHAFSLAAALQALQSGPVITGVPWYEGFDTPTAAGLVEISGSIRGGHEFEIVGYDPATDLVEAVNSWGSSWGVKGRFFFTSKTWGRLLAQQGDCTVPVP